MEGSLALMEGSLVRRHFFCLLSVPYLDQEDIKRRKKFPYSYSTRLAFHMPGSYHLTVFTYYLLSRLVVPASGELSPIYFKDLRVKIIITSNTI